MKPRHRIIDRQEVLVSPQAFGSAGDRLARDLPLHLGIVILDFIRPKALLAHVHRRDRGAMAALFTFETKDVAHVRSEQSKKISLFRLRRGFACDPGSIFLSVPAA